ncbi:MAG: aminotransferase class V-fold PLP-dependent enzyme [Verrucomicrobiaceae bacterium]|nr:aminotransferase class V-fold PLP-dependent enzyme [Verrucomicrobiaceae bacterium]
MPLNDLFKDEAERLSLFPIAQKKIFLAHAAVTALPRCAADAMAEYAYASCDDHQEFEGFITTMKETRHLAGKMIGAKPSEIALLGPTSLGLSLFANGINWNPGDEVVCYLDDYPANVYPWLDLQRKGVTVRFLEPSEPGVITPQLVASSINEKTRLVALASCNFLTGYRIDIDAIGKMLGERDILFSLDAIQTCGAFPTSVEHVDFLSADAHKWLLGPMAIGIVYVKEKNFDLLRPSLLGAWNVQSPDYITQREINFHPTARRYEPGVLNASGIVGFKSVLELLDNVGIEPIARRLRELKSHLIEGLDALNCEILGPRDGLESSSITTFTPPAGNVAAILRHLNKSGVIASCRKDRSGNEFLRFSPHFYNSEEEITRALEILSVGMLSNT